MNFPVNNTLKLTSFLKDYILSTACTVARWRARFICAWKLHLTNVSLSRKTHVVKDLLTFRNFLQEGVEYSIVRQTIKSWPHEEEEAEAQKGGKKSPDKGKKGSDKGKKSQDKLGKGKGSAKGKSPTQSPSKKDVSRCSTTRYWR